MNYTIKEEEKIFIYMKFEKVLSLHNISQSVKSTQNLKQSKKQVSGIWGKFNIIKDF